MTHFKRTTPHHLPPPRQGGHCEEPCPRFLSSPNIGCRFSVKGESKHASDILVVTHLVNQAGEPELRSDEGIGKSRRGLTP
jgi:hypothetical protein